MIDYDFGTWGFHLICRRSGSVLPKALYIAIPNALVTMVLAIVFQVLRDEGIITEQTQREIKDGCGTTFSSYTFVLGFLLVFRSNISYSRWDQGGEYLERVGAHWFNATSNLIAFTTQDVQFKTQADSFQHLLVRLMSMLHCSALQQVADMEDEHYEILGMQGIQEDSLIYLSECHDRSEVILLWIQRLIVNNLDAKVLAIPPPILSRVFQELSNGTVCIQAARKIADYPFPFPYAQLTTIMLSLHWLLAPCVTAIVLPSPVPAGALAFLVSFSLWGILFIAAELERPYGDDDNDLPICSMQRSFNTNLSVLLDELAKVPPAFQYDASLHNAINTQRHRIESRLSTLNAPPLQAGILKHLLTRVGTSLGLDSHEDATMTKSTSAASNASKGPRPLGWLDRTKTQDILRHFDSEASLAQGTVNSFGEWHSRDTETSRCPGESRTPSQVTFARDTPESRDSLRSVGAMSSIAEGTEVCQPAERRRAADKDFISVEGSANAGASERLPAIYSAAESDSPDTIHHEC